MKRFILEATKGESESFLLKEFCPEIGEYVRCLFPGIRIVYDQPYIEAEESLRKELNKTVFKRLLIFNDKYDKKYFLVESTEDVGKAYLEIVRERNEMDYYAPCAKKPVRPNSKPEDFTDTDVKKLIEKRWKEYQLDLYYLNQEQKQQELLEPALNGCYLSAFDLLTLRQNYEYEGFYFDFFEDMK